MHWQENTIDLDLGVKNIKYCSVSSTLCEPCTCKILSCYVQRLRSKYIYKEIHYLRFDLDLWGQQKAHMGQLIFIATLCTRINVESLCEKDIKFVSRCSWRFQAIGRSLISRENSCFRNKTLITHVFFFYLNIYAEFHNRKRFSLFNKIFFMVVRKLFQQKYRWCLTLDAVYSMSVHENGHTCRVCRSELRWERKERERESKREREYAKCYISFVKLISRVSVARTFDVNVGNCSWKFLLVCINVAIIVVCRCVLSVIVITITVAGTVEAVLRTTKANISSAHTPCTS